MDKTQIRVPKEATVWSKDTNLYNHDKQRTVFMQEVPHEHREGVSIPPEWRSGESGEEMLRKDDEVESRDVLKANFKVPDFFNSRLLWLG